MLYAIEDEVRGCAAEQRRIQRAECSRIIVEDLRLYLDARLRQISAKSKLAEAIRYATTRWDGLVRFIDDGRSNSNLEKRMTDDRMALVELIEQGADNDLVREMLAFAAERMMDLEIEARAGAPAGSRGQPRLNHRNGYR
jgi:hypothetical protein